MHRASFLSFPLATSILLGALGAQERRTALSLLPGKPMLVMQAAGPARIALAFKDTNIAKMLGGEELGGLIRNELKKGYPQLTGLLAMLGYRYAKLRDAILGFRGRLTIAFGIDLAGLSEISGQDELLERHQWLAIILSPKNATSGATDLEPMVKKLNRTVERRVPRKLNDLTVGGRRFRTCEVNNDSVLRNGTLPFLLDGHAVLVISNKIKKALKTMLTGQSSSLVAVERKLESKMLAIYVDLQAVWRLFFSIPESDYEDNPRVSRSTLKILQVERIHSMLFSVSPLGPFVAMDTDITLASEGGSIFDAFRVPGTLDDSMLDSIPDDLVGAELFRVDPARLWEFGEKFGAHLAEREGADWDSELLRNNWVCG